MLIELEMWFRLWFQLWFQFSNHLKRVSPFQQLFSCGLLKTKQSEVPTVADFNQSLTEPSHSVTRQVTCTNFLSKQRKNRHQNFADLWPGAPRQNWCLHLSTSSKRSPPDDERWTMPSPRQEEVEQLVFDPMGPKVHQGVGWNHSSFRTQGQVSEESFPVAPHEETDEDEDSLGSWTVVPLGGNGQSVEK